jgi:hypothetical protein
MPATDPGQIRLLWLVLGALFALFVSSAAGVLSWLDDRRVAAAILKGAGAFACTLTLVILVLTVCLGWH